MNESKVAFYDIKINDKLIDESWKQVIENIPINLNGTEIDNCKINLSYELNSDFKDKIFAVEGDEIEILAYYFGDPKTDFESLFFGTVKTVEINFYDKFNVSIESFEKLFELDFDEEPVEATRGESEMSAEFDGSFSKFVEKAKEMFLGEPIKLDSIKKKTSILPFLKQLKDKYPDLIKKININEPDFQLDKKQFKGSGKTDYQHLLALAKLTDRRVFLEKDGTLNFVKSFMVINKPFIYNPPITMQSEKEAQFYINRMSARTTLKGLTNKIKIISSSRIGEGVKLTPVEVKEVQQLELKNKEKYTIELEEKKNREWRIYDNETNPEKKDILKDNYDNFLDKVYNPGKKKIEDVLSSLIDSVNNKKKYSYDILAKLKNGEPVRVKVEQKVKSEEDAISFAKDYLKKNNNDFLNAEIDLKIGNNILRTWQVLYVLIFDSQGESNGYCKRFSGEYYISKVRYNIGNDGFTTSISCKRNFVIED